MSDLSFTSGEGPSKQPLGEARNHRTPPAWLGWLAICIAPPIGLFDYFLAAAGVTDVVLGATAVVLVAVIAVGWARVVRVAPSLILIGFAYLVLAAVVIWWGETLDGAAMTLTGATAVTLGAAMIGRRADSARPR